jgi:ankyrin repeat protein
MRILLRVCLAVSLPIGGWAATNDSVRLVEAARDGNRQLLQELLRQHADVNTTEADGMTALHWVVRADDSDAAKGLISAGANVNAANRYGVTPLMLAATNGSAKTIDLLLKAGANPNAALPSGETILMTASRTGDAASVKLLLAHGADPNAKSESMGETALMWAAAENHAAVVDALIHGDAHINARSEVLTLTPFNWVTTGMVSTSLPRGGWTPLMFAARQGAMDAARVLAGSAADLNATDPDGATALVFAVINAHFDLAAMLLEKGADPNVTDETGMAALYAAVDMHTLGGDQSRPAPKLVDQIDAVKLIQLLLAHGANPNTQLKKPILGRNHSRGDASLGAGTTVLMRAVKTNDVTVTKLLLNAGADPFLTQKDHTNVLMIAAAGGAVAGGYAVAFNGTEADTNEIIKLCLERGVDVNAFNVNGQTALHHAAERGADQVVKFLAENGAKLDSKDRQSRMPIDMALETRQIQFAGATTLVPARESTAALLRQLISSNQAKNAPRAQ